MDSPMENKKIKLEKEEEDHLEQNINWRWNGIEVKPGICSKNLCSKNDSQFSISIVNGAWKGPVFLILAPLNRCNLTFPLICDELYEILSHFVEDLRGTVVICSCGYQPKDLSQLDSHICDWKPSYFMELSSSPIYSCTPFVRLVKEADTSYLAKLNLPLIKDQFPQTSPLSDETSRFQFISEKIPSCVSFNLEIGTRCDENGVDLKSKVMSLIVCLNAISSEMNAQQNSIFVQTASTACYTLPDFLPHNLRVPLKSFCKTNPEGTVYTLESAFVSTEILTNPHLDGPVFPLVLEGEAIDQETSVLKLARKEGGSDHCLKFGKKALVLGYLRDLKPHTSRPYLLLGVQN